MRKSSNDKQLKELSEILSTATADKPALQQRLFSLLGSPENFGEPLKINADIKLTMKQRKALIKQRFTRLSIREQIKNQATNENN